MHPLLSIYQKINTKDSLTTIAELSTDWQIIRYYADNSSTASNIGSTAVSNTKRNTGLINSVSRML